MNDSDKVERTVGVRVMEYVVAGIVLAFSALLMQQSDKIGASWASDGPQSGYFPFRVGAILAIGALAVIVQTALARNQTDGNFVGRGALRDVMAVLLPSAIYVAAMTWIGFYVASTVFIGAFMWWLGKYRLPVIAPIALGIPVALFLLFELWFKVPLPKGPLETMFGY
ncbi:MAG: tripartite tricarboxylate transporter TctB family protein [Alphaproteobacteria bacterium]|nr:tripartite tricarboxylate transporter TctB family protein [Alphaproteobacteria bacterium]